jgi:hypothetical protein
MNPLATLLAHVLGGGFSSGSSATATPANPRAPLIDALHTMLGLTPPSQQAAASQQQFNGATVLAQQQAQQLVSDRSGIRSTQPQLFN